MNNLIQDLKTQLTQVYQDRLVKLILFGSQARGKAQPESDWDILVVLKGEINPVLEIKKNIDLISNLSLEYEQLINYFYISENRLNNGEDLLIKNLKKEGILL